jgi:hypothetical protein
MRGATVKIILAVAEYFCYLQLGTQTNVTTSLALETQQSVAFRIVNVQVSLSV